MLMSKASYFLLSLIAAPMFSQDMNSTSSYEATWEEAFKRFPSYVLPSVLAETQLLIGIMFTISPIALFLHITIVYIIFFSNKRKKYANTFYRLVVCISCTDIYWCHFQIYQGLCNVLGECPGGDLLNTIIGTGAQFIFFFCMNMDLLIAFNRFSAVVMCETHEKLWNNKKGVLYVFIWMVVSALECTPTWIYKKKYYVEIQTFTFRTIPPEHIVKFVMWFELGCTYVAHSILAVLYISSFVAYRRRLNGAVTMTAAQKKEGRLLYQAVFSGIPCFVMMTFHHLFPIPLIELIGGDWCVLNGPLVYLWFNSEIRSDWLELMGLKKATKKIYMNTFIMNRKVGPRSNHVADLMQPSGTTGQGLGLSVLSDPTIDGLGTEALKDATMVVT